LQSPVASRAGETIEFELLFEGRPMPGVLVKSWQRRGSETLMNTARTDGAGRIRIAFDQGGVWMVSAVHMIPAVGEPDVDWDSFWANLTFRLPS
jgi:uncharacterized GH25 family protein